MRHRLSGALIQMRDWCTSGDGRDTNSREITGANPAARLAAFIGGAAANQIKSTEMGCRRLMSIRSRMSREIRRCSGLFERPRREESRETCEQVSGQRNGHGEGTVSRAHGIPRGWAKDSGAHQEKCCLSVLWSSAINNDGGIDNYLLMRDPSSRCHSTMPPVRFPVSSRGALWIKPCTLN